MLGIQKHIVSQSKTPVLFFMNKSDIVWDPSFVVFITVGRNLGVFAFCKIPKNTKKCFFGDKIGPVLRLKHQKRMFVSKHQLIKPFGMDNLKFWQEFRSWDGHFPVATSAKPNFFLTQRIVTIKRFFFFIYINVVCVS